MFTGLKLLIFIAYPIIFAKISHFVRNTSREQSLTFTLHKYIFAPY